MVNSSIEADGFLKLKTMKVPDFADSSPAHEDYCRLQCLENCSRIAYAYDSGTGCMSWTRSLIDIQKFSNGGVDLYIRVAHSELGELFYFLFFFITFLDFKFSKLNKDERRADSLPNVNSNFNFD